MSGGEEFEVTQDGKNLVCQCPAALNHDGPMQVACRYKQQGTSMLVIGGLAMPTEWDIDMD